MSETCFFCGAAAEVVPPSEQTEDRKPWHRCPSCGAAAWNNNSRYVWSGGEKEQFDSCPSCGSLAEVMMDTTGDKICVRCETCALDGPLALDEGQAVALWNQRVRGFTLSMVE